ncbi:hypothetical protein BHE74_00003091 [Ensete ventricosum]|uniref:Uncharacterized protein n=1 Tax=Ensete ventricosum TaxID=4639 RepID=A0A427B3Q6_ENSVE|nr:hypothetical protein B296_00001930 [Ensete ventricosum]RWW21929.1 hypothetical protein GW17_00013888 [Ensete ventricosum]RWW88046.1 hypothetical protein BHE74_00003091 [Ensete ventricosum]RZR75728.1 hypothetical protein BHM03_00000208 [Ensete ventricosum]
MGGAHVICSVNDGVTAWIPRSPDGPIALIMSEMDADEHLNQSEETAMPSSQQEVINTITSFLFICR